MILGVVGVSGCTSSDSTQTPLNDSNSSYATTTSEPATNSSVDTNTADTGSSSSDYPSSTDYSSGTDSGSSSSTSAADSGTYVGNANTHVFHYSWCYHVDAMKDSNKVYFSSAKAAEDAGYRPCKDCNP